MPSKKILRRRSIEHPPQPDSLARPPRPLQWAEVAHPDQPTSESMTLPAELAGGGVVLPSGLTPIVDFAEIGEAMLGEYVTMRQEVGQYGSSIYTFRLIPDDSKHGLLTASIWGSTILAGKLARSPDVGAGWLVFIRYQGDITTGAGFIAKDFQVKVWKPGAWPATVRERYEAAAKRSAV